MGGSRWQMALTGLTGAWILLSMVGEVIPQSQEDPPPMKLLHSGWAETVRRGNRRITDLYDSVLFQQGDQYVLADRANFLDQQELVTLWGNVRGWDPTWKFWSDRVEYFGNDRIVLAEGSVRALNLSDSTYMESQRLRYNRETGVGVATGSPYLYQPPGDSATSATEVRGKEDALLHFRRDAGWSEMEGGAEVTRGDVTIQGEWLRSDDEPRILTVRDSVRFWMQGVSASGEELVWDEEAGLARLKGLPSVLNRRSEREEGSEDSVFVAMRADSIDLAINEDVLESILLYGKGSVDIRTLPAPGSMRMRSDSTRVPSAPELMTLVGSDIAITLEDEELRRLVATRAAMKYWREDTPDKKSAMGGIDLDIVFENGEPSVVTAKGNAATVFFQDVDDEDSAVQRSLAALIQLVLGEGNLELAHLENGTARQYTADMYLLGKVPMAVHPDSVQVGAGSRPERGTKPPPRPPPPRRPPPPPFADPEPSGGGSEHRYRRETP